MTEQIPMTEQSRADNPDVDRNNDDSTYENRRRSAEKMTRR